MALLLAMLRTLVDEGLEPAELVDAAERAGVPARARLAVHHAVLAVSTIRSTGELTYVNAGQNPPLLRRADGTLERLTEGGIALGMFEHSTYTTGTADARRRRRAGALQRRHHRSREPAGRRLRRSGAGAVISQHWWQDLNTLGTSMLRASKRMQRARKIADDLTVLAVRRPVPLRRWRDVGSANLGLLAIVTFGFIGRAATTGAPLFDHHSWRQADTAMIARNFAESRLNPLYPQIDHRGALPVGYVATGFELQAWLVALIAKAAGFDPQTGRLLSALWFVGSVLLLFGLTRRRYGDVPALATAFVYAFGLPLVLFIERAFLNEALLLCLSFAVLSATDRRVGGGGACWLLTACISMALIGAVKPTFLIVAAGVVALYVERDGLRAVRRLEPYAIVGCGAISAALWLSWASSLGQSTGLSFGLTDKLFDAAVLFDHGYGSR